MKGGNNPLDHMGLDSWRTICKHQRYATELGEDGFGFLIHNAESQKLKSVVTGSNNRERNS